ncbi:AsmA family protein [Polynucleobacter sp. UK-Kesae-W10]|uniref:AsmA family protein n=1 Tax=Polynucleobacter sp. UK-Kesae-W10 TaxID=1819738 RepID=UPI001C0E07C2|nr:AsmA family protein [Polynucleobacter sp. UK-Kesae-W10]MBU3577771.1 AsmA family protein [Polynucleobacter sp. UK-Kesae-W10]
MNKTVKISLLVLLSILCVGSLAIWAAASFIKPEQLARLLSSTVKESTGRDLTIKGAVGLKLFPSLGITADQVALSNASWAKDAEMLTVKHLEMDIEILPLLKSDVSFNTIILSGAHLFLETNRAGQANWDFTTPVTAPQTANTSKSSVANSPTNNQIDPVRIKNLVMSDAHIHYHGFGSPVKQIEIPKLSLVGSTSKTAIDGQVQYADYQLGIKGGVGNLHDALNNWNTSPVKMKVDLALTVNGKTIDITGDLDKKPAVLPSFDLSLSSKAFEITSLAGGAALAGSSKGDSRTSPSAKSSDQYFFSAEDLPFDALPVANGKLALKIDQLSFPGHVPLTGVKGNIAFDGPRIAISDLAFGLGKGSAQVQGSLSQFQGASPAIAIKGLAKGFTLEQLMDAVDSSTKVKGGDSEVAFNLRGTGKSMHQIASNTNGAVQVTVGKGSLDSRFIDRGGDLFITIVNAINPLRKATDQTALECAVIYLPINNGQVTINDSIGIVTDRLDVVFSGSVDLKTEALNIKIDPREKSGLTTGLNLAGLVKMQGTLLHPATGVNKEGVVNSAVSIGLGILTGGATLVAENARSIATKSTPCKTAFHAWSDIYPGAN